jgi:hypothetical protein
MDFAEGGLPGYMIRPDPMYPDVERRELVARIHQRLISEDLLPVFEPHDADLADAADPGAGGFHVDDHEIEVVQG